MKTILRKMIPGLIALTASLAPASFALAHVWLDPPHVETGSALRAVLRVGHGCDDFATRAVIVQVPAGFQAAKPLPKPGWSMVMQGGSASWTADGRESMLLPGQRGDFILTGTAPRAAGPLWFKVLQICEQGRIDWSQVPAQGTSTAGLKTPAALLEVLSPQEWAQRRALPEVEGAWVRSSVPGQQGTGAFMKLTARQPLRLVGASTPAAGTAEVHEMKIEGDVMRMRPAGQLELAAGRPLELKPGGYHLMLQDLKQPLIAGSTVPLTLVFRDAEGRESRLELKLPVAAQAPGAPAAASVDGHRH